MSLALTLIMGVAASDAPICTDRPAKANAVCTVPNGRFQLETAALGWARVGDGDARTETFYAGSSLIKYGLGDRSDLQLAFSPYVRMITRGGGEKVSTSGPGDLTIRYKHRLTSDQMPIQVALVPFLKAPTAKRAIGNRRFEGGVAVPISFGIGDGVTATLGPELDLLADGDGHGLHLALVNLANLSAPIADRLTVAVELWSSVSFDPAGTTRQVSADAAVAYALSPSIQLDAGTNVGLTAATTDVEFYTGLSFRF